MWDLWWTKWQSDRFFSKHFVLAPSELLHHCSIPIFILTLLLSVGQAGEAREPSHKTTVLGDKKAADVSQGEIIMTTLQEKF
jgi:hypothetical protein